MSNQNELMSERHLKIINKLRLADENLDDWYTADDTIVYGRKITLSLLLSMP